LAVARGSDGGASERSACGETLCRRPRGSSHPSEKGRAAREGLGTKGAAIEWIHADVLDWVPERSYDLWHDRAVFHFLADVGSRRRYLAAARSALRPGGCAVIGAFAKDGPARCSGLPVTRYDAPALADAFGPEFSVVGSRRDEHRTPGGASQMFTWVALRRTGP
jgi:hypothetical protein